MEDDNFKLEMQLNFPTIKKDDYCYNASEKKYYRIITVSDHSFGLEPYGMVLNYWLRFKFWLKGKYRIIKRWIKTKLNSSYEN